MHTGHSNSSCTLLVGAAPPPEDTLRRTSVAVVSGVVVLDANAAAVSASNSVLDGISPSLIADSGTSVFTFPRAIHKRMMLILLTLSSSTPPSFFHFLFRLVSSRYENSLSLFVSVCLSSQSLTQLPSRTKNLGFRTGSRTLDFAHMLVEMP